MAADQQVSLSKSTGARFTLENFLGTLSGYAHLPAVFANLTRILSSVRKPSPSSDPIQDFSSSSPGLNKADVTLVEIPAPESSAPKPPPVLPPLKDIHESDSDDFPEIGALLAQDAEERKKIDKQKELMEIKMRALKQQKVPVDSDDDLEIVESKPAKDMQTVIKHEAEHRKTHKAEITRGRKRQMLFAGLVVGHKPKQEGIEAPLPKKPKGRRQEERPMTQEELNRALKRKVDADRADVIRKKEEEWLRRGGKLAESKDAEQGVSSAADAFRVYAEKGKAVAAQEQSAMEVDEEGEDGSDEEWTPDMRGSASPAPREDLDDEDAEAPAFDDTTLVQEEDESGIETDPADENDDPRLRSRHLRRNLVNSDSEEENDENAGPPRQPSLGNILVADSSVVLDEMRPFLAHRDSISESADERTTDEGDKENNTHLMYDRSEDKENKAVARHPFSAVRPALGSRQGSLFGLEEGVRRHLSMSPGGPDSFGNDDVDENDENEPSPRKPFSVISDDDPFQSQSLSFPSRLSQQNDSGPSTLLPSPSLKPFAISATSAALSQPWDDEPEQGVSLLQPAFSGLFEAGTERQTSDVPLRGRGILNKACFALHLASISTYTATIRASAAPST